MWNTLLIGWAPCLNKLHDTLQRIIPILTAQLICIKSVHSAVWRRNRGCKTCDDLHTWSKVCRWHLGAATLHAELLQFSSVRHIARGMCAKTPQTAPFLLISFSLFRYQSCVVLLSSFPERNETVEKHFAVEYNEKWCCIDFFPSSNCLKLLF